MNFILEMYFRRMWSNNSTKIIIPVYGNLLRRYKHRFGFRKINWYKPCFTINITICKKYIYRHVFNEVTNLKVNELTF